MSYLAHLGTRFDAGLESLGHMTWKLLRKKIIISAYKYSYKIEDALKNKKRAMFYSSSLLKQSAAGLESNGRC